MWQKLSGFFFYKLMKFTEGLPNCFTMSFFFILILEQYSDVGHFSFFPLLDNRTIIWCWSLFLLPSSWYWNNILMLVTFLSLLFLKLEHYSDVGHFSFSPLLDTGTIFWCWSLFLLSSSWNWNNILMLVTFPSPLLDTRTIFWCWSLFLLLFLIPIQYSDVGHFSFSPSLDHTVLQL